MTDSELPKTLSIDDIAARLLKQEAYLCQLCDDCNSVHRQVFIPQGNMVYWYRYEYKQYVQYNYFKVN